MAKRKSSRTRTGLPPLVAAVGTVALAVGTYLAIVWLGRQASEAIADRPRYQVRFEDMECDVPWGMDKGTFLAEVRYLASPPGEFSRLDTSIPSRLAAAFAKHPWVEEASPGQWPSVVKLKFRVPVLAVVLATTPPTERAVDGHCVLLPSTTVKLPRLLTPQPPTDLPAGQRWPNPDVRRAIDLVRDFDAMSIEKTVSGWRIVQRSGRALTLSR